MMGTASAVRPALGQPLPLLQTQHRHPKSDAQHAPTPRRQSGCRVPRRRIVTTAMTSAWHATGQGERERYVQRCRQWQKRLASACTASTRRLQPPLQPPRALLQTGPAAAPRAAAAAAGVTEPRTGRAAPAAAAATAVGSCYRWSCRRSHQHCLPTRGVHSHSTTPRELQAAALLLCWRLRLCHACCCCSRGRTGAGSPLRALSADGAAAAALGRLGRLCICFVCSSQRQVAAARQSVSRQHPFHQAAASAALPPPPVLAPPPAPAHLLPCLPWAAAPARAW